MRITNKGGVTPCDRRFDRRKVAITAAAVLLCFATTARAGTIELAVVPALTVLDFEISVSNPALPGGDAKFGTITSYPTGDMDGDTTNMTGWGTVYMDYTPGVSIDFLPSSRVNYFDSGIYYPARDNAGNMITSGPGVGTVSPGQIGYDITHPVAGLLGWGKVFNVWQTFGTLDTATGVTTPDGGSALPFTGSDTYTSVPVGTTVNALLAMDGWLDVVSGILVDQVQLNELFTGDTPNPSMFPGNVATFDGVTLTLPLASVLVFPSDGSTYTITTTGTLTAIVVPEPSTMILFGFSVVGLLSYAWRARKRRA